jgi:hypothetical protein
VTIRRVARLTVSAFAACVSAFGGSAADQAATAGPQDATTAILAAFDRYDAVGMNAAHGNEKQDEFILALIRHPTFASKVNDVVVECGNSLYQPILDRYIAGDDVAVADVRQTWRETSLRMCALSGFYEGLFPAIRAINQNLPKEKRLRVLVCEPAIDWSVTGSSSARSADRNPTIASVMTTEVFAKHRKALMLIGVGHLWHGTAAGTAVADYEKTYPGRTLVIDTHNGFAAFFDLPRGQQLEARMRSWPVPSIVPVKGSWLAELDLRYFLWPFPRRMAGESYGDLVDAYLYLGAGASLTYERTPESILSDQSYIAELAGRFGSVDVEALRRRNVERVLFTPADRAEARQFAPGAEYVGTYAAKPDDGPLIEVDFRRGVLAARLGTSTTWTPLTRIGGEASFELAAPDGTTRLDFEGTAGSIDRVIFDAGREVTRRILVRMP